MGAGSRVSWRDRTGKCSVKSCDRDHKAIFVRVWLEPLNFKRKAFSWFLLASFKQTGEFRILSIFFMMRYLDDESEP